MSGCENGCGSSCVGSVTAVTKAKSWKATSQTDSDPTRVSGTDDDTDKGYDSTFGNTKNASTPKMTYNSTTGKWETSAS